MPASAFAYRRLRQRVTATTAAIAAVASLVFATAPEADAAVGSSDYIDSLGRPTPLTVAKVNEFADQPFVPTEVADALRNGIAFFAGTGEAGGPPLPADAPNFTQFIWPTISPNCMGPGLNSTASALAVPGPVDTPSPGAGAGQSVFVFTALGTPAAAAEQGLMNAYWINLNTLRTGVTPLQNNGINPTGPTTLSATADTGQGQILAVIDGSVRTAENTCRFAPTAAGFSVR